MDENDVDMPEQQNMAKSRKKLGPKWGALSASPHWCSTC